MDKSLDHSNIIQWCYERWIHLFKLWVAFQYLEIRLHFNSQYTRETTKTNETMRIVQRERDTNILPQSHYFPCTELSSRTISVNSDDGFHEMNGFTEQWSFDSLYSSQLQTTIHHWRFKKYPESRCSTFASGMKQLIQWNDLIDQVPLDWNDNGFSTTLIYDSYEQWFIQYKIIVIPTLFDSSNLLGILLIHFNSHF